MADREWWTDWNLSYADDVFGDIYGGHSVQEAVYRTLDTWLLTYIAEFNRKLGSEVLLPPLEYRHRPDYRTMPKGVGAAILVSVPGTASVPEIFQDSIRAEYRIEIMIFVYGTKDWQETEAITQAYATAVRATIVQNKNLMGLATTTRWEGEEYLEGEHSSTRTTGLARLLFTATIGNVMSMNKGLPLPQYAPTGAISSPTTLPPSPKQKISSADVTITKGT